MDSPTDIHERVTELMPGMWRIQTPLPGHSFGTLNSYLLTSSEGAIIIDTPWATPSVIDCFLAGIEMTGTDPRDIRFVLVTHYHEDHSGAAGWLQQNFGSTVVMHRADAEALSKRFGGGAAFGAELERWLDAIGADEESRRFADEQQNALNSYCLAYLPDLLVDDGFVVELGGWRLEVLHTPGHTPGHVCFVERARGLLFVGDHVFERRRNNATARPFAVDRPISSYWSSTQKLVATGVDSVFPGHDAPFVGLTSRFAHLADIRETKRKEVVRLATERSTVWDLAKKVSRRAPWSELDGNARLAAAGETLAYLLDAEDAGQVISEGSVPSQWLAAPNARPVNQTNEGRAHVESVL